MKKDYMEEAAKYYNKLCEDNKHDFVKINMELITEIARLRKIEDVQKARIDILLNDIADMRRKG